jgi:predicted site-specific integrase-resolvase
MRRVYGLATREERLKDAGLLTLDEIAARLGLHKETVKQYRREGRLKVRYHPINEDNQFMYEDPDADGGVGNQAPIAARAGEMQYE